MQWYLAKKSRIQTTLLKSRKHGAYVQDPETLLTDLTLVIPMCI